MTKEQRFKYEMLVRVRDYGAAHQHLLPSSSSAGERFAQVTAAVAAIDEHLKDRIVAMADARRVKATTRAAVFDYMKAIALAARRLTEPDAQPSRFRMPRRRSLKVEVSTARVFLAEAALRQDEFVRYGLPPTFISEFQALVDALQAAIDVRLNSKTVRRQARQGLATELARGFRAVRDLDAIVGITTRHDPIRFAAWQSARRIEGQGSAASLKANRPLPVTVTAPPPATDVVVALPAADATPASPAPSAVDPPSTGQPAELAIDDALDRAS